MNNENRVPKNDVKIENRVNKIIKENGWSDVEAWTDDGSVGVRVKGGKDRVVEVSSVIWNGFNGDIPLVGDGVQQGSFWVNGNNISGELDEFVPMSIGGNLSVESN